MQAVAREGIRLVCEYLPRVMRNPCDNKAHEAIGLAMDLGGYAIMLGGANGTHLTGFSLIDGLSHGRTCAIMHPYYTVLFRACDSRTVKSRRRAFQTRRIQSNEYSAT